MSHHALLDRMREAIDQARLSDAADLFDRQAAQASVDPMLLRARVYIKKERERRSDRVLEQIRFRPTYVIPGRAKALAARDRALSNKSLCRGRRVLRARRVARRKLIQNGEIPYWRGRRYLEEQRPEEARSQLQQLRSVPGEEARIEADLLESGILTQQHRYLDGALILMHVLEFMDGLRTEHRDAEIWALHTLASDARELSAPKVRRFVQSRVARQEWTQDFRVNQFQTYKAVAWCYALEGDYFSAFRYLKMAGAIAPSDPWRAMILLDRAYLALCIGESVSSRSELAEAEEIIDSVEWRNTADEERVALPIAAELLAPIDPARAASYLSKFFALRDAINPLLHFRHDDRLKALAEYANALVQKELGNRKSALSSLRYAWSIYSKIGYDWRAGRCAMRLYELTREERWRERATEKLRNYTGEAGFTKSCGAKATPTRRFYFRRKNAFSISFSKERRLRK